jgi:hypothetical protein
MEWIRDHTPPHATFAVNTYFWLPGAPHGTDAGYWIPYFTGRSTTAGVMLNDLGPKAYQDEVVALSQLAERLEADNAALAELSARGVQYVYIGARGDFAGRGLQVESLLQSPAVELVYQAQGVSILRIR